MPSNTELRAEAADLKPPGECDNPGIDRGTFFPTDGRGVVIAKKICQGCVVIDECLEYALNNRIDHGVWGGQSERQRRKILKERKSTAP